MDARILLVEDDPSIREITALGLRGAGFSVATAADGHEGLARFRADRRNGQVREHPAGLHAQRLQARGRPAVPARDRRARGE